MSQMLVLNIGQGVVYLLLAPLVVGTLRWAKARLQRRQGPGVLQFYRDLRKLLGKQPVVPERASWLFFAAPAVVFACYGALGFLAPVFLLALPTPCLAPALGTAPPVVCLSPVGDLLLLVYLLGLARLTLGLAGMSTGTPFGGLGSSRELFVHVLAEPTLIFIVFTLALKWRTTDLPLIIWQNRQAGAVGVYTNPSLLLLLAALALVTLAEAGRLPFDDPESQLELAMFGKAIELEYGGPQLALLEWAEALRLTFLLTLLSNLFVPWVLAAADSSAIANVVLVALYPARLVVLVLAVAFWEAVQVKRRLRDVMTPALTALVITLIAAVLVIAERYS